MSKLEFCKMLVGTGENIVVFLVRIFFNCIIFLQNIPKVKDKLSYE